jgi:putative tryptophan/tyrosine transport system substrate-binding protein
MGSMRRRDFVTLVIGGTIAVWPLATRAQQPTSTIRHVGFLTPQSAQTTSLQVLLDAFHEGLKLDGLIEGQNIVIEYRFADGKENALPRLAAELVQSRVDAIEADGTPAIQAAKNATQTMPIIMAVCNDPVASSFVASLNRPGGNITGLSLQASDLAPKRLQLLAEIVPRLSRVGVLSNPLNRSHVLVEQVQNAAQSLHIELHVAEAPAPDKFESAFATIAAARADAVIVLPDGMFYNQQSRIAALSVAYHLPTLFAEKESVEAGGLMAYGPSVPDLFRRSAAYLDKILKGVSPADLPVEQPTKFELAINLKTARTLGLTVPSTLLATADEVIE